MWKIVKDCVYIKATFEQRKARRTDQEEVQGKMCQSYDREGVLNREGVGGAEHIFFFGMGWAGADSSWTRGKKGKSLLASRNLTIQSII